MSNTRVLRIPTHFCTYSTYWKEENSKDPQRLASPQFTHCDASGNHWQNDWRIRRVRLGRGFVSVSVM